MGSQFTLVLLVMASGFVAAGLLNALHRSFVNAPEEEDSQSPMVLSFDTLPQVIWSMVVCVFAGPYLVITNGLYFWRLSILPASGLLVCGLLSVIWSFCSGIFVVELALALSRI